MATFDTSELDKSIESFQETIEALNQIKEINQALDSVAQKIGEQDRNLKEDTALLRKSYQELSEALNQFEKGAEQYASELRELYASQKKKMDALQDSMAKEHQKTVSEVTGQSKNTERAISQKVQESISNTNKSSERLEHAIQENIDSVKEYTTTFMDKSAAVERAVLDYTTGTQKSIDELRILETNNARETRDKIVETDARMRADLENRFKMIEQINTELSAMKKQQKIAKIFAALGFVSALLATASSALHFFIH